MSKLSTVDRPGKRAAEGLDAVFGRLLFREVRRSAAGSLPVEAIASPRRFRSKEEHLAVDVDGRYAHCCSNRGSVDRVGVDQAAKSAMRGDPGAGVSR